MKQRASAGYPTGDARAACLSFVEAHVWPRTLACRDHQSKVWCQILLPKLSAMWYVRWRMASWWTFVSTFGAPLRDLPTRL